MWDFIYFILFFVVGLIASLQSLTKLLCWALTCFDCQSFILPSSTLLLLSNLLKNLWAPISVQKVQDYFCSLLLHRIENKPSVCFMDWGTGFKTRKAFLEIMWFPGFIQLFCWINILSIIHYLDDQGLLSLSLCLFSIKSHSLAWCTRGKPTQWLTR